MGRRFGGLKTILREFSLSSGNKCLTKPKFTCIFTKVNRNSYEGSTRKSGVECAFLTGAFVGSGHSVMMRIPLMMIISYLRSDVYV